MNGLVKFLSGVELSFVAYDRATVLDAEMVGVLANPAKLMLLQVTFELQMDCLSVPEYTPSYWDLETLLLEDLVDSKEMKA